MAEINLMPSVPQLLILLALAALVFFTVLIFAPTLKKAGYPQSFALLLLIPFVNIIAIWVFAFIRWPNHDRPK